jgi:hypothetical protein
MMLDTTYISGWPGRAYGLSTWSASTPKRRLKLTCCSGASLLVAHDDDEMLVQRIFNLAERVVAAVLREIRADDFGADARVAE